MSQFGPELIALALFALFYLILRFLIIRRPITHSEYENWFFASFAIVLAVFLILQTLR